MTIVDASVMVSVLYPEDAFHEVSRAWLERHVLAGQRLTAPTIILSEIAGAIARRTDDVERGQRAIADFRAIPRLTLIIVDDELASQSADLAAELRLRGADAIYVALAAELHVPLITWDLEQRKRGGQYVDVRQPHAPSEEIS